MDDPRPASIHSLSRRVVPPAQPVKARVARIHPKMSPDDAFRTTLADCLAQMTANAGVLRHGRSTDGLHQLRIGLRRLEVALKSFGEAFEQPWLEELGIRIIRRRVEECEIDLFTSLDRNDILFIDSSHVIRPQGDVLFEYLEVLPLLKPGVFVHIHDIFTPRDYPHDWVVDRIRLWNEQYLLEAFLSFNTQFRVVGALNFLKYHHPDALGEQFPMIRAAIEQREPGSFWIVRQ